MGMEHRFDVSFVSALALREKAIQQNYRPIIGVHKWFARRPGTLFRALMLSEFVDDELARSYFLSHQFDDKRIADPFMGGGTPLIEANRLGADVIGWDINPMAWWIVGRELEELNVAEYVAAANGLIDDLGSRIGRLYETECGKCSGLVPVKCFLWVKTQPCASCERNIDLFPGHVIATNARHPRHVLACRDCGCLNEVEDRDSPGDCGGCGSGLHVRGVARRGRIACPECETENRFPTATDGPLEHRMFAMEYHCAACKGAHRGRFFKAPSARDLERYDEAAAILAGMTPRYIPDDGIPSGDESSRLHRWGYTRYREMFNPRQLLGLEISCRLVASQTEPRVRNALATNLSDLLRYNNLLVRYDTTSLKALDVFSVHGFPVGLVRAECNVIGIRGGNGKAVGSGGWVNVAAKYKAAKDFCANPYEVPAGSRRRVHTSGEWIGDSARGNGRRPRTVDLRCGTATEAALESSSLDAVLTDPPYYDSVQYAELMDFCYVWLRRLVRGSGAAFDAATTRHRDELTGNSTAGRDLEHFTAGLAAVYVRMARALKPGAPLAFTYHHNRTSAYYPVAVAILDAGLVATATIPCPAEMGGSIHISGTKSSIVDTIFVCRAQSSAQESDLVDDVEGLARLVSGDVARLRAGGVKPTRGDVRCIALGHIARVAVWALRSNWDRKTAVEVKIVRVKTAMERLGSADDVCDRVQSHGSSDIRGAQVDLFEEGRR